jgi:dihydropteroate synthase|tara:strand:- start:4309 stop:5172 length:864 start_codon:yes stop_codon:yes gene_type:complete
MKEYINKSNMNPDNLLINNKSILMMGIINATPDSFSGDGIYSDKNNFELLETCQSMIDAGVGIIDIGGESTRPKSIYNQVVEISEDEEIDRVIPLIKTIRKNFKIPISIDSKKTKVIKEAIKEGVNLVNDISMLEDENIIQLLKTYDIYYVLTHYRKDGKHKKIISEMLNDLNTKLNILNSGGIKREKIILDPGIGFGKKYFQSAEVLSKINLLKKAFNLPVMVGASRKSFIGEYIDKDVNERIFGTAATVAYSIMMGANIVRVHDYKEMIDIKNITETLIEFSKKE